MSRVVELLYSRRVPQVAALALMSFGFAGCSADMQTRLSQNNLSNPFASQPETTSSVRTPAVERRELPQYSRPQAQYQSQPLPPPIAAPQSYPTAHSGVSGGGRGLASYAPPTHQPTRDDGHRRSALGRGRPRAGSSIGAGRHHDHRRHQRHARYLVAPLQRFLRRDPAGQWLQGTARAVARPATDHSPSDRGRRGAGTRPGGAGQQAGGCCGRADGSRRQSRRHLAQHRASQPGAGGGSRQGQRPRFIGHPEARPETERARRKERRGGARRPAGRRCRRSARPGDADGCIGRHAPAKRAARQRHDQGGRSARRPKLRSRPAKQPARFRHSAGRCAAR